MGVPLVVLLIGYGQKLGLLLLILAAISQGLREFYGLTLPESRLRDKAAGISIGLCLPIGAHFGQGETVLALLALAAVVVFLLAVAQPRDFSTVVSYMSVLLFGIMYVSFLLSHIVLLGNQPRGAQWILFLLFTIWAGDTLAYFTGMLFGKHKLYPRISPKKSVEGLLGGLVGSTTTALLCRRFLLPELAWSHALFLGFFLMILGQLGDFGESLIKRSVHVKDSSQLLPGHGGVLDRLDSFLFSAPFLYYYSHWLRG